MQRRPPHSEVIDAEYVVVRPRLRISWWAVFWWCVYTWLFAMAARSFFAEKNEDGIVLVVVGAALIVPGGRLVTWFLTSLGSKVSEDDADELRSDLLGGRRRRKR